MRPLLPGEGEACYPLMVFKVFKVFKKSTTPLELNTFGHLRPPRGAPPAGDG